MKILNGAQSLLHVLEKLGVRQLFGYPGGAIMPVYDALAEQRPQKINHVLCRHEQGCAFAAQGYARSNGEVGVCLATSGPGATNLITGIADAYLDSIPLLIITGQVETKLLGTDAFQEVDMIGMSLGVVKHSFQITSPSDLVATITDAYALCRSGRPGPVLIDLPKDIQKADIPGLPSTWCPIGSDKPAYSDTNPISKEEINQAFQIIHEAKRPAVIAGGGIKISGAETDCRRFVEQFCLPVATTLNCIGLLAQDHPLNLGMLGMHGTAAANDTIEDSDLIISLGARFDDRATGQVETFANKARIIHVDIDPAELGKNVHAELAICGSVKDFIEKMLTHKTLVLASPAERSPTLLRSKSTSYRSKSTSYRSKSTSCKSIVKTFLKDLGEPLDRNSFVTVDVGQHQMWVAQYFPFHFARQFLSSSGLGTMGFGLPAAIGAQIAHPDKTVFNITGDGSFMMNLQELSTVKRYGLPIKIVMFNNRHLGLVRQQQELFYGQRYSEVDLSDNPDFPELVKSFGFTSGSISSTSETAQATSWLKNCPGPVFLEVNIPANENVWPFVIPGQSNSHRLNDPGEHKNAI